MSENITQSGSVIIYPEFEKTKADVEKLRTEISMLILERDELIYVQCENIETAYMLSIGGLEYKEYEIECAILRLKRKAELIQAKKNRQEKIIVSEIDDLLDYEFSEYQKNLDEQIEKMNKALKRNSSEALSEEEEKELKKLYRTIVKALHPDLNPDVTEAKKQLFNNAVLAYENADLCGLRLISEMVSDPALVDLETDELSKLVKEKERLSKILIDLKDEIAKIKSDFPYTMLELLQDSEKIEERKLELQKSIEQLNEVLKVMTKKVEDMLR